MRKQQKPNGAAPVLQINFLSVHRFFYKNADLKASLIDEGLFEPSFSENSF